MLLCSVVQEDFQDMDHIFLGALFLHRVAKFTASREKEKILLDFIAFCFFRKFMFSVLFFEDLFVLDSTDNIADSYNPTGSETLSKSGEETLMSE